ncbi:MAG: DinB family protein [Terriglobales bacterium]
MGHNLEETIALLGRTPATLNSLLRDLPETWTHRNEGDGTFTAYDVVGHLIYADREDWLPRARRILEHGEAKPFDAFDHMGHVKQSKGKSLSQLLDEFLTVRAEALDQLRALNLHASDMERRGRHPALGPVTMSELLATWAGHDLTHLHQVSRIMAHQYREVVGPFAEYLGVMKCGGHGG